LDSVSNDRKKSDSRRKKDKKKGKNFRNISSDEDELDKIKKALERKNGIRMMKILCFIHPKVIVIRMIRNREGKEKRKRVMVHHIIILVKGQNERSGKKEYTYSSSSDGSN
jgi:hypothetical protein